MFDQIKLLLLLAVVLVVTGEDCDSDEDDIFCADHGQCCGGCCVNGVCIDTYRACTSDFDVCEDHICIGEEFCIPYMPPRCAGCEPVPVCTLR